VAGRDDRFFPLEFQRRVARDRLGVAPVVVPGGHLDALSRPDELAAVIAGYLESPPQPPTVVNGPENKAKTPVDTLIIENATAKEASGPIARDLDIHNSHRDRSSRSWSGPSASISPITWLSTSSAWSRDLRCHGGRARSRVRVSSARDAAFR
jgi:hypothetical protein